MKRLKVKDFLLFCLFCLFVAGCGKPVSSFRFTLTGDPRAGLQRWRHTLEQMKENAEIEKKYAFHIAAGDYYDDDPPTSAAQFYELMQDVFGRDVRWYPGVGNHELKGGKTDLYWLEKYYYDNLQGKVNPGPPGCSETTYSWDYKNAHFVQLDMYCEQGRYEDNDGAFSDYLYNWLIKDLDKNTKPVVFVIYHEPAFPNGRGGKDESPPGWRRFMKLLNDKKVVAGLCAHTHTYARYQVEGDWDTFTWEVDAGNAGRTSHGDEHQTYLDVTVFSNGLVEFDVWQGNHSQDFQKTDSWSVRVPVRKSILAKQ